MDTGTRGELLAADLTVSEVRDYLGCDTLAYLELDRLLAATGAAGSGFCTACLTGKYPVEVPVALRPPPAEAGPVQVEALEVDPAHPCG
jgi:amidophosphoribosyltransferase